KGGAMPFEVQDAPAPEPRSAYGVQLARGAGSLTTNGTVTYVEEERCVGLGNLLMARGSPDYVTKTAYIHHVVPSIDFPFKVGSVVAPVGALAQDRSAGVAGRLGHTPRMIPVTVSVHDLDRDVARSTNFEIVSDDS